MPSDFLLSGHTGAMEAELFSIRMENARLKAFIDATGEHINALQDELAGLRLKGDETSAARVALLRGNVTALLGVLDRIGGRLPQGDQYVLHAARAALVEVGE